MARAKRGGKRDDEANVVRDALDRLGGGLSAVLVAAVSANTLSKWRKAGTIGHPAFSAGLRIAEALETDPVKRWKLARRLAGLDT